MVVLNVRYGPQAAIIITPSRAGASDIASYASCQQDVPKSRFFSTAAPMPTAGEQSGNQRTKGLGDHDETCPPPNSASGSGRGHSSAGLARRMRSNVSIASDHYDRALSRGWRDRRNCPHRQRAHARTLASRSSLRTSRERAAPPARPERCALTPMDTRSRWAKWERTPPRSLSTRTLPTNRISTLRRSV